MWESLWRYQRMGCFGWSKRRYDSASPCSLSCTSVFCTILIAFASHSGNRVSTTATINMYGVTKTIGSQGTASAEWRRRWESQVHSYLCELTSFFSSTYMYLFHARESSIQQVSRNRVLDFNQQKDCLDCSISSPKILPPPSDQNATKVSMKLSKDVIYNSNRSKVMMKTYSNQAIAEHWNNKIPCSISSYQL